MPAESLAPGIFNEPDQPVIPCTVTVRDFDQHDQLMHGVQVSLTADEGEISQDGRFKAPSTPCLVSILASSESVQASATISVFEDDGDGDGDPGPATTLGWRGQVPPLKWMNFYTKVLSKWTNSGNLRLNVDARISPNNGVTDADEEEMKRALKDLGLDGEVTKS